MLSSAKSPPELVLTCCSVWKPNRGEMKYEDRTSNVKMGPIENKTSKILGKVLTFSTCSVVKGPPYLFWQIKSGWHVVVTVGEGTWSKGMLVFFWQSW